MLLFQVKWSVIKAFIEAAGKFTTIWTVLFHILFLTSVVLGNIWLSTWTNDAVEPNITLSKELTDYRSGVYGGIIALQSRHDHG